MQVKQSGAIGLKDRVKSEFRNARVVRRGYGRECAGVVIGGFEQAPVGLVRAAAAAAMMV